MLHTLIHQLPGLTRFRRPRIISSHGRLEKSTQEWLLQPGVGKKQRSDEDHHGYRLVYQHDELQNPAQNSIKAY